MYAILEVVLISMAGAFLLVMAVIIILKMCRKDVNIVTLFCEIDNEEGKMAKRPKASMSRFQMMVWTFVIAYAFLYLVIVDEKFPAMGNVLALLGINGGTYITSKVIQKSGGKKNSKEED